MSLLRTCEGVLQAARDIRDGAPKKYRPLVMGADQIRPYQALQNRAPCSGGERSIGTRRSQGWRFARASLLCRSERYVGSNVDPIFMGLKEESYHFWRGPPPPYQSTQVYFGEWGLLQKWDDSPHFIQRWTPPTNKDGLRKVHGQHHPIGILIESKYLRRYFAPPPPFLQGKRPRNGAGAVSSQSHPLWPGFPTQNWDPL